MRERVTTRSGRSLTKTDVARLVDRLDEGIDLSAWQPRRGRPPLDADGREHSPRIAVRVPEELNDRVRTRAAREGRSVSDVVRGLLEEYAPANHPTRAPRSSRTQKGPGR